MREYGSVSPQFWIGETGKKLRGDMPAQLLAMYLMTSPHSTMTGVFHCPILYMAHETGIPLEGATKALQRLCEVGFCEYDHDSESVFVVRMAAYQIAEHLKPGDNRIVGIRKEVQKMVPAVLRARFIATYSVAFSLEIETKKASPSQAPPKPLPSQEQEQEQEQEGRGLGAPPPNPAGPDDPAPPAQTAQGPSMAAAVCVALKSIGMGQVSPGNQNLKNLIDEGADIGTFVEIGRECVENKKPFAYLLAKVRGRMSDAALAASAATAKLPTSGGMLPGAI